MERDIIPYLYLYDSVPAILEHYSRDLINSGDKVKRWKANRLLEYRSALSDAVFLESIRDWFNQLYDEISSSFPSIPFELLGRRKSLDSTTDKISRLEKKLVLESVTDNPFKRVRDFLAFRITLFDSTPGEFVDELYQIADVVIDFFTSIGLEAIEHDKLLDTEDFDNSLHPEIYVPTVSGINPFHESLIKDYVYKPKKNGYQSIHILLRDPLTQRYIEIQLRTLSMHIHAEIGDAGHAEYKSDKYLNNHELIDFSKIHIRGFRYVPLQSGDEEGPRRQFFDYAGVIHPVIIVQKQKNFAASNQYF